MTSNAAAYYHWPTVWVGSAPPASGADIDISTLEEEVYRTTLPVGIAAKVFRDGMFIFDFSDWPPGRALPDDGESDFDAVAAVILQRVNVLNAHLVCLYTALSRRQNISLAKMTVAPSDLIMLKSLDDTGMSFADTRVAALVLARHPSTYVRELPTWFDWRVSMRKVVVEIDVVHESFQLLATILQHSDPYALLITDLCARSCKAYEDHNYSLCLVTAWAITEKLLQDLWNRYVEANREKEIDGAKVPFINKARKKKLIESRDFSASVISEVLSLMDYLPFPLYRDLSRVRKARNDWIHGLGPVSRKTAELSVRVAEAMLELVDGLNLKVPLIPRIHM